MSKILTLLAIVAMMLGVSVADAKGLPYDAEVEWIATDGLAYAKTGFFPDNTCGHWAEYTPLMIYNQVVCGARQDSGDTRFFINFGTQEVNSGFGIINPLGIIYGSERYVVASNYMDSRKTEIFDKFGNKLKEISLVSVSIPSFAYDVYILNANRYGSTGTIPTGKLHRYKLTRGASIEMDFIPVRFTNERGETEGAMYDRVSGRLFRNSGTGSFVIGPDKAPSFSMAMGEEKMRNPYPNADKMFAWWDGEWNDGIGVHSSGSSVIKGLVGGCDLDIYGGHQIEDKGIVLDGIDGYVKSGETDAAAAIVDRVARGGFTAMYVYDLLSEADVRCAVLAIGFINYSSTGIFGIYGVVGMNPSYVTYRGGSAYSLPGASGIGAKQVQFSVDDKIYFYRDGRLVSSGGTLGTSLAQRNMIFGGIGYNFSGNTLHMRLRSIRFYDLLTAEEIAAENEVDTRRFYSP